MCAYEWNEEEKYWSEEGRVVCTDSNVYTSDEDAVFIAHAHQDIPALIAEVRRLEREVDRLDRD